MKKVVTIGGGTGQYNMLVGLKKYDIDLTAIANVVDSGGSSGGLRVNFGVLPPGDIRNCLIALAGSSTSKELADLFLYRFESENKDLNHSMGNLILTALSKMHGDMGEATKIASRILSLDGDVLPASTDSTHLHARTVSGKTIEGEKNITAIHKDEKIEEVWLSPDAFIYGDSAKAIREADLIVICAGELWGSIIPNFLVKGFSNAIKESNAKIVYVNNLVTKQGNYGFKASDFLREIEKYLGKSPDYIICNTKKPTKKIVDKYIEEESFFVEPDLSGENVIKEDLLEEVVIGGKITARHDSQKLSKLIMDLLEK